MQHEVREQQPRLAATNARLQPPPLDLDGKATAELDARAVVFGQIRHVDPGVPRSPDIRPAYPDCASTPWAPPARPAVGRRLSTR